LILLDAEYRRITGPLLQLIRATERDYPNRLITVLIPEVVKDHWWHMCSIRTALTVSVLRSCAMAQV
jgi:hypothetical protein